MKKVYYIYASVVGSKYIGTVEAETEEEALELGWGHNNLGVSLCHQCSNECSDPEIQELFAESKDDNEEE